MWSFVSLSFPLTWGSSSVEINLQHLNLTTSPIQHRAEDFLGGEDVSPWGLTVYILDIVATETREPSDWDVLLYYEVLIWERVPVLCGLL